MTTYTDPFAKMVAAKAAQMQLNKKEKDDIVKQLKADQRSEDRREAAQELYESLQLRCTEKVLFLRSSPSVVLKGQEDTDFHIYVSTVKVGCKTRLFCRSTTLFDRDMMVAIVEGVIGDDYRIDYKGDGQYQIGGIEWGEIPELINMLCAEAREWLE
ncbi:hypothetical protein NVP1244A_181 [Vibrio phage 1.244.A._10N.261.54.C3]|nr:hypothetical protein NVP1244A_181 [Vibrio phage 1.244.A._10N.261.54.C3]AUR98809.1 hypothetical protein NVP1255O_181 [Vibrio phage 1.255.O._10N.286.45.F1]